MRPWHGRDGWHGGEFGLLPMWPDLVGSLTRTASTTAGRGRFARGPTEIPLARTRSWSFPAVKVKGKLAWQLGVREAQILRNPDGKLVLIFLERENSVGFSGAASFARALKRIFNPELATIRLSDFEVIIVDKATSRISFRTSQGKALFWLAFRIEDRIDELAYFAKETHRTAYFEEPIGIAPSNLSIIAITFAIALMLFVIGLIMLAGGF